MSTIRRHPRGLKTNFVCAWHFPLTHIYIYFSIIVWLRIYGPVTPLFSQLTYPHCSYTCLAIAHSFASIWQFPYINRRQGENARRNNFKPNLPETYVAWLGLHAEGLPYRTQSLKQSELEHESFSRRVLWNSKTFTVLNAMFLLLR